MRKQYASLILIGAIVGAEVGLAGCATRGFVNREVESANALTSARIEEVATQVEQAQSEVSKLHQSDTAQGEQLEELSTTAREALARAQEAGVLARGKLLMEVNLADDSLRFTFDRAELNDQAKSTLDAIAENLKARNENVYIEIQGHTDASGPQEHNLRLGEERAMAVRRYLAMQHRIPLHRMNVISYGEASPVADNTSRDGRATNRRVSLVVLS